MVEVRGANREEILPDFETSLRSYQLEALEKAKRENTIAYLETGSGKTLIAVMLLKLYAHLLRKPSPFIGVFLVPTVVLVSQQAKVVEMHSDLKVAKLWGEMGVDDWDAATWQSHVDQFEVFVMTPQILLDCLRKTFLQLDCIKLLIFDECHHAKGRSPYACIMTEFYHRKMESSPSTPLPRIFGMTASPINSSSSNYKEEIVRLETMMNSKVYTVDSEEVLSRYIPFSKTRIVLYEDSVRPSHLYNCLEENLRTLKLEYVTSLEEEMTDSPSLESVKRKISKLHDTFVYCLTDLGAWLAAKAAELLSTSSTEICSFFWGEGKQCGANSVRTFSQLVYKAFSPCITRDVHLSSDLKTSVQSGLIHARLQCLVQCLAEYREVKDLRCIVFVERVITAIVLKSFLSTLHQLSRWGIEFLVGSNSNVLHSRSINEKNKIVDAFRRGEVNIIIATQILEEGLDVPSCNLVVRFDPAENACSFIQSRGRARCPGSDYLLLVRRDDIETQNKVREFLKVGEKMREESLKLSSKPCEPLDSELLEEDIYRVEKTGAIVTFSSCVSLIYKYCFKLPSDRYFKSSPRFVIDKETDFATVHFPKNSALQVVSSRGRDNLSLKRIVCLEACKKLHQVGALNDYLLPHSDSLIDDDDAFDLQTAMEPCKEEHPEYFPVVLLDSWSSFTYRGIYCCYLISFEQQGSHRYGPVESVILALRSDVGSDISPYSFNLVGLGSLTISLQRIYNITLSASQVSLARRFQTSLLSLLMDHDFAKLQEVTGQLLSFEKQLSSSSSSSSKEVCYLLLPCKDGRIDWATINSPTLIFNKMLNRTTKVHHVSSCKLSCRSVQTKDGTFFTCMLKNSIVYTAHNGHFYFVNGILESINANSYFDLRKGESVTYKSYYKSKHDIDLTCENTPFLSGRHIGRPHNYLFQHTSQKEKGESNGFVELPPELCSVILQPLQVHTLDSFLLMPTIMHRFQCVALASALRDRFCFMQNVNIPSTKILEAITAKKCHEEFSYESLETLGDSFLKYAASQHLFAKYEHHHEGILSNKKDILVSNTRLWRIGCLHNLAGYARTEVFNPKMWGIPGLNTDRYTPTSTNEVYTRGLRPIKSKVIADLMEALIGAFLSTAGEAAAFLFLEKLDTGIRFHQRMAAERPILGKPEIFVNINELEKLLDYKFNDPSLLVEALTHGSYQIPEVPRSYQRLEFLGDAVLDRCVTIYLYGKYYPAMTPGLLTDLRSASTNNDCYAHAAVKAGLNKHILHASSELHRQITTYLERFGNFFSGSSYGWDAGIALPKVLGDVIESLAGAIYLDCGCDKDIVWRCIRPMLEPIVSPETMEYNPIRQLGEFCDRESYIIYYKTIKQNGVSYVVAEVQAGEITYSEKETGPNKKTAKKLAARAMLKRLEECEADGPRGLGNSSQDITCS